jgi:hypothetical protein
MLIWLVSKDNNLFGYIQKTGFFTEMVDRGVRKFIPSPPIRKLVKCGLSYKKQVFLLKW